MRVWRIVAALSVLACGVSPSWGDEPEKAPPAASSDEVRQWIADLDADKFSIRQQATHHLSRAGLPAVEAVTEAAKGESLEAASRAIEVLMQMANGEDADVSIAAEASLESLVENEQATTLNLASSLLQSYRREQQPRALEELKRLGATVAIGASPFGGDVVSVQVTISTEWTGGDKGLRHLKRLPDLIALSLLGAPITDAGVEDLSKLKQLKRLDIFGTQLTDAGAEKLGKELANTEVARRTGPLLGVRGPIALGTGCSIRDVVPKSAADKHDIRVGDVIVALDDTAITSFEQLADLVGKKKTGDTITLKIDRDRQRVTKEVKLGSW